MCCKRQIGASARGRARTIAVRLSLSCRFLDNRQLEAKVEAPPACQRAARGATVVPAAYAAAGSAVALLLLLLLPLLRLPETFLKEVDEGLTEVLAGAVAVQEVPLVGVDLQREARRVGAAGATGLYLRL